MNRSTTVVNVRDKAAVAAAVRAGVYVYVGRTPGGTGEWGNRYSHLPTNVPGTVPVETREEAIRQHRKEVLDDEERVRRIRRELRGKVLGCWCAPYPCHAQTLADIADGLL